MSVSITQYGAVTQFMEDLDACEGKTIKSIHDECPSYSDYKIVRFTDGTALAMSEREDGGFDLSGNTFAGRFSLKERVYFGIEPPAAYEAQQVREAAERAAGAEARERELLATLKAKYETPK